MSEIASAAAAPVRRRYILFLLFLVSMFNYIDRTIVSILQVPIKHDLSLTDGAARCADWAVVRAVLFDAVAADREVGGQGHSEAHHRGFACGLERHDRAHRIGHELL